MTDIETTLPRAMQGIAADITSTDSETLAADVSRAARTTKVGSLRAKPFLAGLAAAAVTAVALIGSGALDLSGRNAAPTAQPQIAGSLPANDSIPLQIAPGTPCVGASKVDFAQARGAAKTPVWLPADGRQLSTAWMCAGETPAFTYGNTTVFFEPGWGDVDVAAKWADLADEYGGRVEKIGGQLALIQPPTRPNTKPQVMIVRGDTLIRILGEEGSEVNEAVGLAKSLRFN